MQNAKFDFNDHRYSESEENIGTPEAHCCQGGAMHFRIYKYLSNEKIANWKMSLDRWIVGSLDRWFVGSLVRWFVWHLARRRKST